MTLRHVVLVEIVSAAGLTGLIVYSVESLGNSRYLYLLIPFFWALALGVGYALLKVDATNKKNADA